MRKTIFLIMSIVMFGILATAADLVWDDQDFDNLYNIYNVSNITAGLFKGQPMDGSIGSAIIYSSKVDSEANVNISCTGLTCTYPNLTIRLAQTDNTIKYCELASNSIALTDETHNVVYIDNDCAVQKTDFATYIATDLSPGGLMDIFNAMAHSGSIEVLKGVTIESRVIIKLRQKERALDHLVIVTGMELIEENFPNITIGQGEYVYLRGLVNASKQNSSAGDGVEFVYRSGGTWSYDDHTGLNLTHCDDGTNLVECSLPTRYRRYFMCTNGFADGVDNTETHQLAASNSVNYVSLSNCLDTEANPLVFELPDHYTYTCALTYAYCGRGSDSDWTGEFIDLRETKVGSATGISESDPISVHTTGDTPLIDDWDAGSFYITALGFNASDWWNVTITESQVTDLSHIGNCSGLNSCNNIIYNNNLSQYLTNGTDANFGKANITNGLTTPNITADDGTLEIHVDVDMSETDLTVANITTSHIIYGNTEITLGDTGQVYFGIFGGTSYIFDPFGAFTNFGSDTVKMGRLEVDSTSGVSIDGVNVVRADTGSFLVLRGQPSGTPAINIGAGGGISINGEGIVSLGAPTYLGADDRTFSFGATKDFNLSYDGSNPYYTTAGSGVHTFYNSSGLGTVRAGSFITGSNVPDTKSNTNFLSKLNNIDSWKSEEGIINYENHYAGVKVSVVDKDNCWEVIDKYCLDPDCWEYETTRPKHNNFSITYREECGTKLVDGLDLEKRASGMEGMIYELKQENQMLKDRIAVIEDLLNITDMARQATTQHSNLYICQGTEVEKECVSLSNPNPSGLQTRCYQNEEKTSWFNCNTGWVKI